MNSRRRSMTACSPPESSSGSDKMLNSAKQGTHKTCKQCFRTLPIAEFHRDKGLSDGHRNICKACAIARTSQSRKDILERTSGLLYVLLAMKSRCYNPKHNSYPRYGGRGISICKEWLDNPESFYNWAKEHGHKPGLQLDRINNDLGYYPDNCRFVTPSQNQHNTSRTPYSEREVEFFRRAYKCNAISQKSIAEFYGVDPSTISRICSGETWKNNNL